MDLSTIGVGDAVTVFGIIAAVISSAAYINFKAKAKPVMGECAKTLNLIWVFFKDATDGDGKCDMSQAPVILAMIEKCLVDLAALAPFIKEILVSIPKRK